jgi:hypothetical protein
VNTGTKFGDPCTVDGCDKPINGQGLCNVHYGKARRAGTLAAPLTPEQRFWSRVKKTDTCWLWTGTVNSRGYGTLGVKAGQKWLPMKAHRMSYELTHGPIPAGIGIDHRCRNRLCVNPDHLRLATSKQNNENLDRDRVNNKTGFRGVYKYKGGRFAACVGHQGRKVHIGYFDTAEEANAAVIAKRNELFTHNDADRNRTAIEGVLQEGQ